MFRSLFMSNGQQKLLYEQTDEKYYEKKTDENIPKTYRADMFRSLFMSIISLTNKPMRNTMRNIMRNTMRIIMKKNETDEKYYEENNEKNETDEEYHEKINEKNETGEEYYEEINEKNETDEEYYEENNEENKDEKKPTEQG